MHNYAEEQLHNDASMGKALIRAKSSLCIHHICPGVMNFAAYARMREILFKTAWILYVVFLKLRQLVD